MQVFVCDYKMSRSAQMLDNKRLNKQIVEAFQIVEDRLPNLNHPAYRFWRNHKDELRWYMFYLCEEYTKRFGKVHKCSSVALNPVINSFHFIPYIEVLLLSHKVNLLRKNFDWYSQFFTVEHPLDDYPLGSFWNKPYGTTSKSAKQHWLHFWEKHYKSKYADTAYFGDFEKDED